MFAARIVKDGSDPVECVANLLDCYKFNLDHPADFRGHSLSVSDVVVAKGKAYYVDTFGFKELKAFKAPEREQKPEQDEQKKPAAKKPKR